ncbi:MAG: thioredoxin domain-containing protein [Pyrinomonadaceae bacterium]|nr:thioredoxin domain-containing protein [Pyrinomonadaceae bacterium]
MKRYLPFIIIAAVLAAVALIVLLAGGSSTPTSNTNQNLLNIPYRTPTGAEPPHAHGSPNAPIILEEFGDFQCPPCRLLHPVLKQIEADYDGRVRVIFRQFPLSDMHANALQAARAAEAAAMQDRFWEMHNQLYEKQDEWKAAPNARAMFIDYARSLGMDRDKFTRDMDGEAVYNRIIADGQRAHALGVNGTPTVFLNNRELQYDDIRVSSRLRSVIDAALRQKGL